MGGTDGWSGRQRGLLVAPPRLVPSWRSVALAPAGWPLVHGDRMSASGANPLQDSGGSSFPLLLPHPYRFPELLPSTLLQTVLSVSYFHVKSFERVMCFLP